MRRWKLFLSLLLLLGTLYNFYVIWEVQRSEVSVSPPPSPEKEIEVSQRPLSFYSSIEKRNLFDLLKETRRKVVLNTPPPLELKGTVVGGERFTFAVIENKKTRKQKLLRIGDNIDNWVVKKIGKRDVLLEKGGETITLRIKESVSFTSSSPEVRMLEKERVEEMKKRVSQILSQVRISPFFRGGKMEGFRVNYIIPGSVVEEMGIKRGDIIKSINGEILNTPGKVFEVYRRFQNADRIVMEIDRGGVLKTLVFQVEG